MNLFDMNKYKYLAFVLIAIIITFFVIPPHTSNESLMGVNLVVEGTTPDGQPASLFYNGQKFVREEEWEETKAQIMSGVKTATPAPTSTTIKDKNDKTMFTVSNAKPTRKPAVVPQEPDATRTSRPTPVPATIRPEPVQAATAAPEQIRTTKPASRTESPTATPRSNRPANTIVPNTATRTQVPRTTNYDPMATERPAMVRGTEPEYPINTPVNTYDPNNPVNTYVPNDPVNTYDPNNPVNTYDPNNPVNTYDPNNSPSPEDSPKPQNLYDNYDSASVSDFAFSDLSFMERGRRLLGDVSVTNIGDISSNGIVFSITFYDEDGTVMAVSRGLVGKTEPGETKTSRITVTMKILDCSYIEYDIISRR